LRSPSAATRSRAETSAASRASSISSRVEPRSRAAQSGLRAGDYIRGVNRRRVDDLQAFQDLMDEPPVKLQLDVVRGNRTGYVIME